MSTRTALVSLASFALACTATEPVSEATPTAQSQQLAVEPSPPTPAPVKADPIAKTEVEPAKPEPTEPLPPVPTEPSTIRPIPGVVEWRLLAELEHRGELELDWALDYQRVDDRNHRAPERSTIASEVRLAAGHLRPVAQQEGSRAVREF